MKVEPQFFETSAAWRAWLRKNRAKSAQIHIGYFKSHTGKPSITWAESVAEALCFGWIDGVRKRINDDSYTIRFTPRKAGSTWSAVNIRMVAELEAAGRMTDAGRAAFAVRVEARSRKYSYEQNDPRLDEKRLRTFKRSNAAWVYFQSQAPSYQKKAVWWIMSAEREDARDRRFARLLDSSAAGTRLAQFAPSVRRARR